MSDRLQLPAVGKGIQGRIAQERNDRDEELGTYHIHLIIFIGNIHNSVIVEFVVNLEEGHQHRIFAFLFPPVLVKLLQKILILVFGCSLIHLVLHLEHDGDKFRPIRGLPENKISLTPCPSVIVLLKVRRRKRSHPQRIKLIQTVLLQALSYHLGGLPCLEVFIVSDQLVLLPQLFLKLLVQ